MGCVKSKEASSSNRGNNNDNNDNNNNNSNPPSSHGSDRARASAADTGYNASSETGRLSPYRASLDDPNRRYQMSSFIFDSNNLGVQTQSTPLTINLDTLHNTRRFTYAFLASITENFRHENFLGEGGFGQVHKGVLPGNEPGNGEIVAVKKLDDPFGFQGDREFMTELMTLSRARHPNLVELIGFCAEGDERLLVYQYMPLGSLEDHLFGSSELHSQLDWNKRIKIMLGAARGIEYLHNRMEPPIIYRDMKPGNVLLEEGYHARLSDFGLAREGPTGGDDHVETRLMGTYGYCAPDYAMTGRLNYKSDVFSFGVVLLEVISGRRALEQVGGQDTHILEWAREVFSDRDRYWEMLDPSLSGQYPSVGLFQAIALAAMCVQENPRVRPTISEVVSSLSRLASRPYDPQLHGTTSGP